MGQVIHVPVPWAAYPATTEALDTAERILLLGVRWWVADYRKTVDTVPRPCEVHAQRRTARRSVLGGSIDGGYRSHRPAAGRNPLPVLPSPVAR
jgi:hypothetical protein